MLVNLLTVVEVGEILFGTCVEMRVVMTKHVTCFFENGFDWATWLVVTTFNPLTAVLSCGGFLLGWFARALIQNPILSLAWAFVA